MQEIYGLLLGHYLIRVLIDRAAAKRQIDPDRISFTNTLKIPRCRLPECPREERGHCRWHRDLIEEISEEIIEPRVMKKKMSNWPKKRRRHRHYPQPSKEFREAIVMLD